MGLGRGEESFTFGELLVEGWGREGASAEDGS